jgi:ribosome production factor 2
MIEFGVESHQSIDSFVGMKKTVGSKPLLAFLGSQWEKDSTYMRIENLFIDLFRGTKFDKLSLQGIDHVITFTAIDGIIYLRGYAINFKKSGTKVEIINNQ